MYKALPTFFNISHCFNMKNLQNGSQNSKEIFKQILLFWYEPGEEDPKFYSNIFIVYTNFKDEIYNLLVSMVR